MALHKINWIIKTVFDYIVKWSFQPNIQLWTEIILLNSLSFSAFCVCLWVLQWLHSETQALRAVWFKPSDLQTTSDTPLCNHQGLELSFFLTFHCSRLVNISTGHSVFLPATSEIHVKHFRRQTCGIYNVTLLPDYMLLKNSFRKVICSGSRWPEHLPCMVISFPGHHTQSHLQHK